MDLTGKQRSFLEGTNSAAMITIQPNGNAHAVRIGVAVVDGRLWASGTQGRARTTNLRRDPRCTLFVFDRAFSYLTLETTVEILETPEVPQQSLRLFRTMQNRRAPQPLKWNGVETPEEEFLELMVAEERLIYEFEITGAYGMIP